uniref:SJCHGC02967 protein n=1 Tax=Schistosoma japonicum TaxID=6182 RepID=Q5DF19_SCHJA|nr:SJCHGC02967 protein [Schistosoma japonicum]
MVVQLIYFCLIADYLPTFIHFLVSSSLYLCQVCVDFIISFIYCISLRFLYSTVIHTVASVSCCLFLYIFCKQARLWISAYITSVYICLTRHFVLFFNISLLLPVFLL